MGTRLIAVAAAVLFVVGCVPPESGGGPGTTTTTSTTTTTTAPPPPPTQLSVGAMSGCAALGDGSIRCWGNNDSGQLGDGTVVTRTSPVRVSGITDAVSVDSGEPAGSFSAWTTCAVRADRTAWCWGSNGTGAVGNGSQSARFTSPQLVSGLTDVAEISTGNIHACARLSSGSLRCWGWGIGGKLGNGDASNTVQRTPVAVATIDDAVDLSAGSFHSCAVRASGTVWCWGSNSSGQLGTGDQTGSPTPLPVLGLNDAVSVSTGYSHTCAVRSGGEVACWGSNFSGQLGNGLTGFSTVPVTASGLNGALEVSAGRDSTCTRSVDGTAACWGSNVAGALGLGTTGSPVTSPQTVPGLSGVTSISINGQQHFGTTGPVLGSRDVACFGSGLTVKCAGSNEFGQLATGTTVDSSTPVLAGL